MKYSNHSLFASNQFYNVNHRMIDDLRLTFDDVSELCDIIRGDGFVDIETIKQRFSLIRLVKVGLAEIVEDENPLDGTVRLGATLDGMNLYMTLREIATCCNKTSLH